MITYNSTFNGLNILTDKERGLGCDTLILSKTYELIQHYLAKHNKVFCTRFDLRFPSDKTYPANNFHLTRFISSFSRYFRRNGLDLVYLWVREQSREKHHHYHLITLCNGNKIQAPYKLLSKADELWTNILGDYKEGLVDYCLKSRRGKRQTNSYMLRRNDPNLINILNDCFQRFSYLAKTNTKGYAPKNIREYGASRIPKNS